MATDMADMVKDHDSGSCQESKQLNKQAKMINHLRHNFLRHS